MKIIITLITLSLLLVSCDNEVDNIDNQIDKNVTFQYNNWEESTFNINSLKKSDIPNYIDSLSFWYDVSIDEKNNFFNSFDINFLPNKNVNTWKITFITDKKNEKIEFDFENIDLNNIPDNINHILFWALVPNDVILNILTSNIIYSNELTINIVNSSFNNNLHEILVNLPVENLDINIWYYWNCDSPINYSKNISDLYLNSDINEFNLYYICSRNVMNSINCNFEWVNYDSDKLYCWN